MFFAIILIAFGLALLLSATGLLSGGFWGVFWGIIFLAIGIRMIRRKESCPMCTGYWHGENMKCKMDDDDCECEHDHEHEPEPEPEVVKKSRKQK